MAGPMRGSELCLKSVYDGDAVRVSSCEFHGLSCSFEKPKDDPRNLTNQHEQKIREADSGF